MNGADITAAAGTVSWVDGAMLAVVALSVITGLVRGLVFELMSLAGWVVAYLGALWLAPQAAPHIPVGEPGSPLNHSATMVACFLGVLIAWGLLSRLVRMAVAATPLTLFDRLLGAGFGALRALVLLAVVVTVVALTPAARAPVWRESVGVQWVGVILQGARPLLPDAIRRWLGDVPAPSPATPPLPAPAPGAKA